MWGLCLFPLHIRHSPLQVRGPVSKANKILHQNINSIVVVWLSRVENDVGSNGFQLVRATA